MASSAAAVAVGRLGKQRVRFGARAVTVQRVGRKVVAVRAETASLAELEGRVKHWAIRSATDAASHSAWMKQASLLAFHAVMALPALAEEVEREPKGRSPRSRTRAMRTSARSSWACVTTPARSRGCRTRPRLSSGPPALRPRKP